MPKSRKSSEDDRYIAPNEPEETAYSDLTSRSSTRRRATEDPPLAAAAMDMSRRRSRRLLQPPGPRPEPLSSKLLDSTISTSIPTTMMTLPEDNRNICVITEGCTVESRRGDNVSLGKGRYVGVVERLDRDRWVVLCASAKDTTISRKPTKGYIDAKCLRPARQIFAERWFHGSISSDESTKLLENKKAKKGMFHLRLSSQDNVPFTLAVKKKKAEFIRIYWGEEETDVSTDDTMTYTLDDKRVFLTVHELLKYYAEHELLDDRSKFMLDGSILFDADVDPWEVDRELIQLDEIIHSRRNKVTIHKAYWKNSLTIVVKEITGEEGDSDLREAEIMKKLHHKNVVQLFGVCSVDDPKWILMEYMFYGNFLEFLRGDQGSSLTNDEIFEMLKQTAKGLYHLEVSGIVHRDVAAENVFINHNKNAKVGGFFYARELEEGKSIITDRKKYYHHRKWMAPEVIKRMQYSSKSDVWAFGIVILEAVTRGEEPFLEMTDEEVQKMVTSGGKQPIPQNCHSTFKSTIRICCESKPSERPSFKSILEGEDLQDMSEEESDNGEEQSAGTYAGGETKAETRPCEDIYR